MINPLEAFLWTVRRSERDVVNMYESLSPVMQLATGGTMLNFGYWAGGRSEPVSAQEGLCREFGRIAELDSAGTAVDLGSGLSGPALLWQKMFAGLRICCVNTSREQLLFSGHRSGMEFLNATSTRLPLLDGAADRMLALESSQHFRPYADFVSESRRVLGQSGVLALALPVAVARPSVQNLGVLKFTWSSEHYRLVDVRGWLESGGFEIAEERLIGKDVYVPLADYYEKNRELLRGRILGRYPAAVERVLFWSLRKMRQASVGNLIEYALFKCVPR